MSISEKNESPANSERKHEVQTHTFEDAKNALKKFSEEIPSSPSLPTVATHGFLRVFSRDVTGSELNNLTEKVQAFLIATNQQQIRVIREFEQIYQTFEALDKDYIQGLIVGYKAAETASNQATQAATEAYKVAERAQKNTCDIECLIKTQSSIIDKLMEFKKRIENIPNIDNVSTMWEDIEDFKNEIQVISDRINHSEAWASDTEKLILAQELVIAKIMKFKEEFEAIPHILDLQIIWDDVQGLINQILIMKGQIADIEVVTKERFIAQDRRISTQNDELVSLINKNRVDLSEDLINLNKKQSQEIKDLTSQIEIIQNGIRKNEAAIDERFVKQNTQLHQKIKIAYAVAGTFGAITLTHVVLAVLGIV